ncbi:MAG TPA: J domain-containing protein [Flavobacteriales bacterium]|nr:J domain-containing protein [Flavobacteriales bacterium]
MSRPEPLRYDHYRVLGVPRSASAKEIKQAYRDRVKSCHPDKNTSPQAASLFRLVHEAYSELNDPDRRQLYDERLQFYRSAGQPNAYPGSGPISNQRKGPFRKTEPHFEGPVRPVQRFAFVGLHVTGLCFGVGLIAGILVGTVFFHWPPGTLLFCLPGIALIPDSLAGIRIK